ncbi:MAG: hypothetical protein JW967_09045 [Dehalococcoidales bacterium]|nr:hypothetical protein [Dehalococcoidales bacterium]
MRKIITYGVVTAVLLIATIVMMVVGFTTPGQTEKAVTLLDYQVASNFSQEAYGQRPAATGTANKVYFLNIVDNIAGSYSYTFKAPDEVTDVKTSVRINAVISSQSGWQKEIVVVPSRNGSGQVTINFPIDLAVFNDINNTISEEIGLNPSSILVTLRAEVAVEAVSSSGPIEDSFTQATSFTPGDLTLQWEPISVETVKGYQNGITYRQEGNFGYTINLKPNSLYTVATLKSETPEAPVQYKMTASNTYTSEVLNRLDVTFTYNLTGDQAVNNLDHQVEIIAVLSNPDGPQATFELLPSRHFEDVDKVSQQFTLDTDLIYDLIQKAEGVTSRRDIGTTYQLNLTAKAHTTGEVDGKTLDKTVTNNIPITFTANSIVWPNTASTSLSDAITGTETVANNTRSSLLTAGYALLGFTVAFILLTVWTYLEWRKRREFLPPQWVAAQKTADKHKDIITNVTAIPAAKEGESVLMCSSLDELAKLSDALLKPILHQASSGVHLYVVIDGTSRYEYSVSEGDNKG